MKIKSFLPMPLDFTPLLQAQYSDDIPYCSSKESIDQFIRLVIQTQKGSFLCDRAFGCDIQNCSFREIYESWSETREQLVIDLRYSLENYEARLKNLAVVVVPCEHTPQLCSFQIRINGEYCSKNNGEFSWANVIAFNPF